MDTGDVPASTPGEHGLESTELSVPAMPVIRPSEQYTAIPFLLVDGQPRMIGWQWLSAKKGGPSFVLVSRTAISLKVTDRFPLTQQGWAAAWQAFAERNPGSVPKCRARLQQRASEQRAHTERYGPPPQMLELEQRTLACLRQAALLGGYAPEAAIAIGERYDARFLQDRLGIFPPHHWDALVQMHYSEIEDVEIGGPGLVKTGGRFVGGGFGAAGALEGMAIASVLNALTTRTSVTTIIRIQAASCELFLLWTQSTPEQLRMELSRPLGAIRAAKPAKSAKTSASPVEELAKLADMLQAGLITREEFDQFKAKLLQG